MRPSRTTGTSEVVPALCAQCREPLGMLVNRRCPHCGTHIPRPEGPPPTFFSMPAMRYQDHYVWLVLVSAMDIILTALVLYVWEGEEANPMAEAIISNMGFGWAILFKFGMMLTAVVVSEVVGRIDDRKGRKLATVAVLINAFPVVYTFALLMKSGPPPEEQAEAAMWGLTLLARGRHLR